MDPEKSSESTSLSKRQIQSVPNERRGLLSDIGLPIVGGASPKGSDGLGISIGGGPPASNTPPNGVKPAPLPGPTPTPGPNPGGAPSAVFTVPPTPTSTTPPNALSTPGAPVPGPTPAPLPGPPGGVNLDPNAPPTAPNGTFPIAPGANQTTPSIALPTNNAIVPIRNPLAPTNSLAPTTTTAITPAETGRPPPPHKKPSSNDNNSSGVTALAATTMKTIAIIVGVLAGVYLLWTIFRKWYFRPSKKFEHKLDDYDEDLFKPRPPSFAEKRHDHSYGSSSVRSGASPNTEYQYGGHGRLGANSSPSSDAAHLRSAGAPTAFSHPSIKFGEIHSYTPYTHSVEDEVRNAHEIDGKPSQGIFALTDLGHPPGTLASNNQVDSQEELQLPPPIFDSNSHRLSDSVRSRRPGGER